MTRAQIFDIDRRVEAQMERASEAAYEEWLDSRPVCHCCDKPIEDREAVYLMYEYFCLDCIEKHTERI